MADVNGDGIPDLIVDNYAADTICVLLGNGDGTFEPPQVYPTNDGPGFAGPRPPVVADVNGDGIPDLIYPDYVSANVACGWARATAPSGPRRPSPPERAPTRSRWRTSTATASPTSSSPTPSTTP